MPGMELTSGDPQPWEQQPGEPDRGFMMFVVYRDLPVDMRSASACTSALVEKGYKVQPRTTGEYMKRWRWVERARAWTMYLDRQRQAQMVEEARKMDERIARASAAQVQALTLPALAIQKKLQMAAEMGIDVLSEMAEAPIETLIGLSAVTARVFPGIAQTEGMARRASMIPDGDLEDAPMIENADAGVSDLDRAAAMFAFMEQEGIPHGEALPAPNRKRLTAGRADSQSEGQPRLRARRRHAPPKEGGQGAVEGGGD